MKKPLVFLLPFLLCLLSCTNTDKQESRIRIVTFCDGYSAEEVERNITAPIENAFKDVSTSSITSAGKCIITLSSEVSADSLRMLAQDRMPVKYLPKDTKPVIQNYTDPDAAVIRYVLTSDVLPLTELRKWDEEVLAAELERWPAVTAAYAVGGGEEVFLIDPDLHKLNSFGIGMDEFANAIERSLYPVETLPGKLNLNIKAKIKTPEEIANMIIKTSGSTAIMVKDVAQVSLSVKETNEAVYNADKPSIEGIVTFKNGLSPIEIKKQFYSVLEQVKKKGMPAGISIHPFFEPGNRKSTGIFKVQLPSGLSHKDRHDAWMKIWQAVQKTEGVVSFVSETGYSVNENTEEENCLNFYIDIGQNQNTVEVENALQEKLDAFPGMRYWFVHPASGEWPADYSIKIFSEDEGKMREAMTEWRKKLELVKGLKNIHSKGDQQIPELNFKTDREKAAQYGISIDLLQKTVRFPLEAKVWSAGLEIPVQLKILHGAEINDLSFLKINSRNGLIPVMELITIEERSVSFTILHEDARTYTALSFTVADENALQALQEQLQKQAAGSGDLLIRLEKD
ncbi:MAG: heavy metal efflux pump, CzcA family [Bacteroidetes bacterium]|jgi:multidrug efflux pump subunit AcrB|nr:heavy metal efflux pump, CzcA family [Bacteroidota bacterium]